VSASAPTAAAPSPTPPAPLPPVVVEVRGFGKRYQGRPVLSGIDLVVRRGETLGLIGKSGCGKSTLLRHIAKLEDASTGPVEGSILVDGEDVIRARERDLAREGFRGKRVGMVFQHAALFDFATVERNIAWPLEEVEGLARDAARERARECLSLVELPSDERFLRRDPMSLSGGERKRVSLARTLALRPEVVLYDEPTTGLDPPTTTEVVALVNRLKRTLGVTAIVTSHDMAATAAVADRIAMIRGGRLAFVGTPEAAERDETVQRFMAGEA
jgi:phospholipid/cholesterol/gamma-HCH transport system ATP-binding protein